MGKQCKTTLNSAWSYDSVLDILSDIKLGNSFVTIAKQAREQQLSRI